MTIIQSLNLRLALTDGRYLAGMTIDPMMDELDEWLAYLHTCPAVSYSKWRTGLKRQGDNIYLKYGPESKEYKRFLSDKKLVLDIFG